MTDQNDLVVDHDNTLAQFEALDQKKKAQAERAGEHRSALKQFIDDSGLNAQAIAIARRLNSMSDDAFSDCWRSLKELLDVVVPHKTGQSTPDMFDKQETGDGGGEPTPKSDPVPEPDQKPKAAPRKKAAPKK